MGATRIRRRREDQEEAQEQIKTTYERLKEAERFLNQPSGD